MSPYPTSCRLRAVCTIRYSIDSSNAILLAAPPAGYMDVPEPINNVGKKARKSIDASMALDNDYLCVVAASDIFDDRMGDDDCEVRYDI